MITKTQNVSRCGHEFASKQERKDHEQDCYVCGVLRMAGIYSCHIATACVDELSHADSVERRGANCARCTARLATESQRKKDLDHAKQLKEELQDWPLWKRNLLNDSLDPKMSEPRDPIASRPNFADSQ